MRSVSRILLIIVLALTAGASASAFTPTVPPSERNAILFSWDGAQRAHVMECLSRNELPHLAKLAEEGKLAEMDIVGHKTDTKCGHAQMLTGYEPEVTGVIANKIYKPIPEGYTIFERLRQQFGKDKIAAIMTTGKTHHMGSLGPGEIGEVEKPNINGKVIAQDEDTAKFKKASERIAKEVEMVKNTNLYGEPFYNTKRSLTVWDGDKNRTAPQVGELDLGYLDKYGKGRFFAFFHFSDPDHRGHAKGENSVQYNNALIECDKWLGLIVQKLKDLGIYDKTLIYVTSDHGFDEDKITHDDAPYVFFASNDPSLSKNGDQRDVVPTILAAMGVDPAKISPKLPGKVLTK